MKTLIIHLSDIHFKNNKLLNIPTKIASAINSSYSHCKTCIILVTGDIANAGRREEYEIAEEFLKSLKSKIDKIADKIEIVICPGNHDCDFSSDSTIRDIVIEKTINTYGNDINNSIIESTTSTQNEYFKFQDKYQNKENKLFSRSIFEIENRKILIDSINVAWMSKIKESQGKLIYPIKYIQEPSDSDLRAVIYHHPTNWLEANNAHKFKETLEKNYHFIFTGHEHKERYVSTVDLNSNDHSTYFHGAALHEHTHSKSSFTSIEIDLEREEFFFKTWRHNEKENLYTTSEEDCHTLKVGKKTISEAAKGELTEEFEYFLNSVDIPFQHPRAPKITLDKIYTPINLKKNSLSENEDETAERIKSNHLHNKIIHDGFINILGEPQSGKTTTLKILFKSLLDKCFFPIYVQGESLKKKQKQEIDQIVKLAIKKQYVSPTYEKIIQTKNDRIVILIDSLEASPLNEEAKDEIINYLSEKFNFIAISMGISSFAASFTVSNESSLLSLFTTYNLEEFSYTSRGQLIEAWVKLGQEDSLSDHELEIIVNKKEELMNSLVHSNLLPTLPGHVLLILQYMETGTINPDMSGAYGHIYQSLVTQTLQASKLFAIDVLNAYLANIAFTIFSNKTTSLDEDEAILAHKSYCSFSDIEIPKNEIVENLKSLNIVKENNGTLSFKHQYLYYYFVATYIQKRIQNQDKINELIDNMVTSINRDDSCNILIFYAYLSDHQNIINKLLEKINSQFSEFEPCRFDKDTMEISKLYQEMASTIIINDKAPKVRREERNKALDDQMPATIKNDQPKKPNNLEYKISSSFRALDVLGQVLRSNRSNLSGEMKNNAVKDGCDLALRITSSFNTFITSKSDDIANEIKSHIGFKNLTEDEKSKIAAKFIATITEMIIFSIIKKLSFSLGCHTLMPSFVSLLNKSNENEYTPPSYKLIETMVYLDNSSNFPKNKIESTYRDIEEYHLGKRMLQRLVHFHFLKYKVDHEIKQWAQDKLSIKYVTNTKKMDVKNIPSRNRQ